jgi:hypothetical protein
MLDEPMISLLFNGALRSIEPEGRSVRFQATHIFEVDDDGLILAHWANRDDLGLRAQLTADRWSRQPIAGDQRGPTSRRRVPIRPGVLRRRAQAFVSAFGDQKGSTNAIEQPQRFTKRSRAENESVVTFGPARTRPPRR